MYNYHCWYTAATERPGASLRITGEIARERKRDREIEKRDETRKREKGRERKSCFELRRARRRTVAESCRNILRGIIVCEEKNRSPCTFFGGCVACVFVRSNNSTMWINNDDKPWSPLPLSFDSQILQSIDFYHISRHFRVRDYLVITSHSDVNGELTLGDNDMCCRIQELCANHSRINLALWINLFTVGNKMAEMIEEVVTANFY